MSATTPPNAQVYASTYGSQSDSAGIPVISQRDPTSADINYLIGKRWVNTLDNLVFTLIKFEYTQLEKRALWSYGTAFTVSSAALVGPLTASYLVIDPACKSTSVIIVTAKVLAGTVGPLTVPPLSQEDGNFRIVPDNIGDISTVFYMIIN